MLKKISKEVKNLKKKEKKWMILLKPANLDW